MIRSTFLAALLASLVLTTSAQAEPLPPSGGIFDLQGARALGSSAATAGSSGSEGLFANPGSMGVRAGYVAEALALNERRGAVTSARYLGLAVVDAVSAPVATSVAYLASTEGEQRGQIFILGFGKAFSERMHVGVQGRYLKLGGTESIGAVTADAGVNWEVTSLVTLGVAGFNLVPTHHPGALPQSMGAGLAVGSDTFIRVLADWRGTFLPGSQLANRYAAGLVGLVGGMMALRAGWMHDDLLRTSWWSSGVGLVTPDGFSIDVGYRQSIASSAAREMAVSLRYYPPQ